MRFAKPCIACLLVSSLLLGQALPLRAISLADEPVALADEATDPPPLLLDPSFKNGFVRVNDVPAAFAALAPTGSRFAEPSAVGFPEDRFRVNVNHIQGMATWGDFIALSGNSFGREAGQLYFFGKNGYIGALPMPHGTRHPSGMQTIGWLLLISDSGALVLFDLRPLAQGQLPAFITSLPGGGLGDQGSTLYTDADGKDYILIMADGFAGFRLDPETLELTRLQVERQVDGLFAEDLRLNEGQNLGLLTDANNVVWMLQLITRSMQPNRLNQALGLETLGYEDRIALCRIEMQGTTATLTAPVLQTDHITPYDAWLLGLGSSFRFAGTVHVLDENRFAVLSTTSLPGNFALRQKLDFAPWVADLLVPPRLHINAWLPQHSWDFEERFARLQYQCVQGLVGFVDFCLGIGEWVSALF